MSDALLIRIAEAVEGLRADIKAKAAGAPKPGSAGAADKGAAPASDEASAKQAAAAKAAAAKKAAEEKAKAEVKAKADAAAAAAAKNKGPAGNTKGPNGKYTADQVREKIREVATNASLGKQDAADILDQDGGGVKRVTDLKPENYDKVYEACQVALQTEGSAPAAATPEDDLM
jgi:colicin import membrane protein